MGISVFGDLFATLIEGIKAVFLLIGNYFASLPLTGVLKGLIIALCVGILGYFIVQCTLYIAQHSVPIFQWILEKCAFLLKIIGILIVVAFVLAVIVKLVNPYMQCSFKMQQYFTPCTIPSESAKKSLSNDTKQKKSRQSDGKDKKKLGQTNKNATCECSAKCKCD